MIWAKYAATVGHFLFLIFIVIDVIAMNIVVGEGRGRGKEDLLNLYLSDFSWICICQAAKGFHYTVCNRSMNILTFSNDQCICTFREMFNYLLFLSPMAWESSDGGLGGELKPFQAPGMLPGHCGQQLLFITPLEAHRDLGEHGEGASLNSGSYRKPVLMSQYL